MKLLTLVLLALTLSACSPPRTKELRAAFRRSEVLRSCFNGGTVVLDSQTGRTIYSSPSGMTGFTARGITPAQACGEAS